MAKKSLPKDFLWGYATAAYQIEGSAHADGRGDSIWDTFAREPRRIADATNGDVACDSYARCAEDVALLRSLGARAYRFSVSWPRVVPLGGRGDPVNRAGVAYYSRLVDRLREAGIEPVVTLYHWDLPAELERRYGGLLGGDEFAADFERYARVMFAALGDRVKWWITFNEPWCSSILGYHSGAHAPGRCSDRNVSPAGGDSGVEPWVAGHSILVAHGRAVKAFRDEFKPKFGGQIAITLNGDWVEPWDAADPLDVAACERKLEFSIAWFADPIYHGRYPASMVAQLGDRLPTFTAAEAALVRGSNDYYGMNHYTADFIRHNPGAAPRDDAAGNLALLKENRAGEAIGPETQSAWLRPHAAGFRRLLAWLSARYGAPAIFVTENGTSVKGESDLPLEEALDDEFRAQYFRDYVGALVDARDEDGVNVIGYLAWSLLDNFEWAEGYETRFGVTYVDFKNGQARHPKRSAAAVGDLFRELIEQ